METTTRDFHHPYKPYDIQIDLMNAIYDCIDKGKVGIFESPTGPPDIVLSQPPLLLIGIYRNWQVLKPDLQFTYMAARCSGGRAECSDDSRGG